MPRTQSFAVSDLWTREFRIDLRPAIRLARERPEVVVLGLGVLLRLVAYWLNRAMWLDEQALKGNIVGVSVLEFSAPLKGDQLAPFGFLIFQRSIASVLGGRNYVLRFLPLAAGIGSLVLFSRLAPRLLPRRAALVALALFAFSADLVYYSNEMKPYSLDVAVGLAITLMAVTAMGRTPSPRSLVWLAILAASAPWFSFASAFMVAGCGTILLADAILAGRFRTALLWILIGAGWLANFLASYRASRAMLSPHTTMYLFWDFAFLPFDVPPTRDGLLKDAGLLLEIFVNPLNLLAPGGSRLGVILPLILLLLGSYSLARRPGKTFLLLALPIALAVAASVSHHYPFHGRLILELVPALFLLVAEGTETASDRFRSRSGIVGKTILAALLVYPCWYAANDTLTMRDREFNRHGDLHRNVFIDIPEGRPTPAAASR